MLWQKQWTKSIKIKDQILNVNITSYWKDIHMDARAMDFEDGIFDVVVDKGTLDSVLVSNFC